MTNKGAIAHGSLPGMSLLIAALNQMDVPIETHIGFKEAKETQTIMIAGVVATGSLAGDVGRTPIFL